MPFDFPNAPVNGQIITGPGGVQYRWDGAKWLNAAVSGTAYLPLVGGTMTGSLTLAGNAASALEAVPLQQLSSILGGPYLPLTGGTLTGSLTLNTPLSITGAAGTNRYLRYMSGTQIRWATYEDNVAETGSNLGSNLITAAYTDAGVLKDQLQRGQRGSGQFGLGHSWWASASPMNWAFTRATKPGGVIGNEIAYGNTSDYQPVHPLLTDPISTVSGSPTVTITWATACGTGNTLDPASAYECWALIAGATAVGGLTISGWYKVLTAPTINTFTINAGSNATSSAVGGGTAVTVRPSFNTVGTKSVITMTTGADGFPVGKTDYFIANPDFYQASGSAGVPQYQQRFSMVVTPPETSQTKTFGTVHHEVDLVNRGSDEGYNSNLFAVARPTIGFWSGAWGSVYSWIAGGGTAKNWNTVFGVFGYNGVANYCGFAVQPNALVGAAGDPTGHGGVGIDLYGSYVWMGTQPLKTTSGSSVVTLTLPAATLVNRVNGDLLYIPQTYTLNGVTIGGGVSYPISGKTATTCNVTGTGTASATGVGGGAGGTVYAYFQATVPFAPMQFWGSYKHGIVTTNSRFESGAIIETQPGNAVQWNDGAGSAAVSGSLSSPGVVNLSLQSGGTERARVFAAGNMMIQPAGGTFTDDGVNALQVTGTGKMTGLTLSSGPTIRAGTGAATGTQPAGSMWMRTDGAVGSRIYVSAGGGTWAAIAGV